MSIKLKITIWYTVILLVMAFAFIGAMSHMEDENAASEVKARLVEVVSDATEKITVSDEGVTVDKRTRFNDAGVYVALYDESGEMIEGRHPVEISVIPDFDDRSMRKESDADGGDWYIYDSAYDTDAGTVWVRGIVRDTNAGKWTALMRFFLIAVPVLILVSIAGGYIITQRAFAPVREVTRAAEQITKDGDLSRRIKLGSGSDEIAQLSGAFNRMFERLEHNMEKEKQFTADVSHELRTPLSVIISQSDFAMQDPSYAGEALGVINKEAKDMSSLLSKLLFLSRSDADTVVIEKETVDLSALLEAVAEQQEHAAGDEGISFSSDIESGIKVSCDEAMIMNSVLNLLGNAFKYRKSEGAEVSLKLAAEDGAGASGKTAVISVTDNGPGIAEENIERIWDRFFRESPEERRKDSSGLGLAIVKAMINVNGGTVSADSVKGEGSTFTIKLPMCGMDKSNGNEN